ncbi:NADP oxidoreductase [Catellatospora sp. TT07R-123]|uniref:NADPH-dependent F420 reductase n=1 Tax=Catellatospora sp. TT07R-123 TaxID=2733863 RepID=UPI001B1866CD|nr:NAD(P)-binding domain-containing protein [Catellatospora sp. TT07R-123]GHJ47743.1 NADP oxidoreductase [Catellatospora sp. TT07R-123]
MTTIGFIGSGNIGGTLAELAVKAGYDVVLSNSRGPETLADIASLLGPRARAGTVEEAATAGDLVLVSVPLHAYASIPVAPLANKVVMDTGNYYPERDGQIAVLDDGTLTSSELLQQHLPTSRVVKVFNNIYYKHLGALARPVDAVDRSALVVSGDDAAAKLAVIAFLEAIGYDGVDNGLLAQGGRAHQPGTPAYGAPYGPFEDEQGRPATKAELRQALDAA